MLGTVSIDELDLLGARADEAHVSTQHIDQLWQLIEAPTTKHTSEACHARIVGELEGELRQLIAPDQIFGT